MPSNRRVHSPSHWTRCCPFIHHSQCAITPSPRTMHASSVTRVPWQRRYVESANDHVQMGWVSSIHASMDPQIQCTAWPSHSSHQNEHGIFHIIHIIPSHPIIESGRNVPSHTTYSPPSFGMFSVKLPLLLLHTRHLPQLSIALPIRHWRSIVKAEIPKRIRRHKIPAHMHICTHIWSAKKAQSLHTYSRTRYTHALVNLGNRLRNEFMRTDPSYKLNKP